MGGCCVKKKEIVIVTGSFHTTEGSIEVVTCLLRIWEGQGLFLFMTPALWTKSPHLPLLISHR